MSFDAEAVLSTTNRRVARILWCLSLLICPITIEIVAEVYGVRPGTPGLGGAFTPEMAVNILTISHLMQSVLALVVAYWIWGWNWWIAWMVVLVWGFVTVIMSAFASMSVTGVWL